MRKDLKEFDASPERKKKPSDLRGFQSQTEFNPTRSRQTTTDSYYFTDASVTQSVDLKKLKRDKVSQYQRKGFFGSLICHTPSNNEKKKKYNKLLKKETQRQQGAFEKTKKQVEIKQEEIIEPSKNRSKPINSSSVLGLNQSDLKRMMSQSIQFDGTNSLNQTVKVKNAATLVEEEKEESKEAINMCCSLCSVIQPKKCWRNCLLEYLRSKQHVVLCLGEKESLETYSKLTGNSIT